MELERKRYKLHLLSREKQCSWSVLSSVESVLQWLWLRIMPIFLRGYATDEELFRASCKSKPIPKVSCKTFEEELLRGQFVLVAVFKRESAQEVWDCLQEKQLRGEVRWRICLVRQGEIEGTVTSDLLLLRKGFLDEMVTLWKGKSGEIKEAKKAMERRLFYEQQILNDGLDGDKNQKEENTRQEIFESKHRICDGNAL